MKKIFDDLVDRVQSFVKQRNDLALVIRCSQANSAVLLKLVETMQDATSTEMYWVFPDSFIDPVGYTETIVHSVYLRHELVRLSQEKEGMKPWPPFPDRIKKPGLAPVERMKELMVFVRSLLPAVEGLVIVWGLWPSEIEKPIAYAKFVTEVLKHDFPFPWCHHIRTLIRDEAAAPEVAKTWGKPPRVAWHEPALGPEVFAKAIDAEIGDEAVPLAQRMFAAMMSASIDHNHKRFDAALQKYRLVLHYANETKNNALTAMALNAIGEVCYAVGKKDEANECFQAAVMPASEGSPPAIPVLTNITINLANLRAERGIWDEAEAYYMEVQKLASIHRNPPLKVWAIERLGFAQYQQGKVDAAVESWTAGALVAEQLDLAEQRKVVWRLREHYAKTRQHELQRAVEKRLSQASPAAASA